MRASVDPVPRVASVPAPAGVPWLMPLAVLLTAAAGGITGVLLTLVLHAVQHVSFGYTEETFVVGVRHASAGRRVLALTVGGAVVGTAWWLQRRYVRSDVSVRTVLARPGRRLPLPTTAADSLIQIVAVGIGASLGREGAPRQLGAALGSWMADRTGLDPVRRRTLLGCGAGAGLAAVYNLPFGGAAFTVEILLRSFALADVVPALVASVVGAAVAWPILGSAPAYPIGPVPHWWPALLLAPVLGPVAGVVAAGFRRLTRGASERRPRGWPVVVSVTAVFAALGALAIAYPELLGNGKGLAQTAFDGTRGAGALLVLTALKPLATAACLRAGARGGLLTPAFATGVALGAAVGLGLHGVWPALSPIACGLIGGAAVLAGVENAPLTAAVLAWELTRASPVLLLPIAVAVVLAAATTRRLDRRVPGDNPRADSGGGRILLYGRDS